jgi:hypothetical protein
MYPSIHTEILHLVSSLMKALVTRYVLYRLMMHYICTRIVLVDIFVKNILYSSNIRILTSLYYAYSVSMKNKEK